MREIRPLHDWRRHHPLARSIASQLPKVYPRQMRTGELERAIRMDFGVSRCTAMHAIRFARERT